MAKLEGAFTALITPFKNNGAVDEEGLRTNVEFQIEKGIDGLVPCGTTGESATLSYEEHKRVIEIVVEQANGRVPVIAGTGSNSTAEAIDLTKHAFDVGADYCLVVCPYYNKPTQRGLLAHFKTLASEAEGGLILYNIPSRTGRNIEPKTVIELAELDNVVGIKEASGNMEQIMRIIRDAEDKVTVLSGDDMMTFPMLAVGAKGVISVASNVVPDLLHKMVFSFLQGRIEKSRSIHYRLMDFFKHLFIETNPGPVKEAMNILGMPAGPLRLPMVSCEEGTAQILREDLKNLGLL